GSKRIDTDSGGSDPRPLKQKKPRISRGFFRELIAAMTRQPRRAARRRRRSATKLRRRPVSARLSCEQIELHRGVDFESRDRSGHMLADQGDDDDARSTLVAAMTRV